MYAAVALLGLCSAAMLHAQKIVAARAVSPPKRTEDNYTAIYLGWKVNQEGSQTCIWAAVKCAAPGGPLRLLLPELCCAWLALPKLMTSSPFWKAAISASVGGKRCSEQGTASVHANCQQHILEEW